MCSLGGGVVAGAAEVGFPGSRGRRLQRRCLSFVLAGREREGRKMAGEEGAGSEQNAWVITGGIIREATGNFTPLIPNFCQDHPGEVKGAGKREGRATGRGACPKITYSWGLEHRAKEISADSIGILGTEGGQGSHEQAGG